MSSVIRSMPDQPNGLSDFSTRFVNITTPSYFDNTVGNLIPIPFSYNNGILDIRLQDNVYDLIASGNQPVNFSSHLVRKMGGTGLVTELGRNFVDYLKQFLATGGPRPTVPTDITNFKVYTESVVTKIQQANKTAFVNGGNGPFDLSGNLSQYSTYAISEVAPSGDSYLYSGTSVNEYGTCWVFQTPLTISYTADGFPYYITFTTTFTKNVPS